MAVHKWRRRPTKYFGEVWVPFAQVGLQCADGRFQALALQVDSGAVVSLLRRSAGDLLGLKVENGRKVELAAVGGGATPAYVHEIPTRFDEGNAFPVPFAVATTERVPNLLGRLGVFDNLQIDFDATLAETRLSALWLSEPQRPIYEKMCEMGEYVAQRVADHCPDADLRRVATIFVNRAGQLVATACALLKLHRTWETPLLIRVLFEYATQFEYLMQEPSKRARQYLDFAHVAKYAQMRAIADNPTGPISMYIAASPLRPEGEQRIKEGYDRVRDKFRRNKKNDTWDSWYCMTFRDLAKAVNREGEYKFWYKMGSAHAHGDPFAVERGAPFQGAAPAALFVAACTYYCRILRPLTSSMVLPAEYDALLQRTAKDLS